MTERPLGIIMNGTGDDKARAARPFGTLRPATPTVTLRKGVQ